MLLLLVGCARDPGETETPPPVNQGLAVREGCVEEGRASITDRTAAGEGMSFPPSAVEQLLAGLWLGSFSFVSGDDAPAAFDVAGGGTWEVVQRTFYEGGETGEGMSATDCGPFYAWTTAVVLVDDFRALDESFPVTVEASSKWTATLFGALPLEEVVGTTRPTEWAPSAWESNALAITATATALDVSGSPDRGWWDVSVRWQAGTEGTEDSPTSDTGATTASGAAEEVGTGSFF